MRFKIRNKEMEYVVPALSFLLTVTIGALIDSVLGDPIKRRVHAWFRGRKRVQRVLWPDDRGVFEKSWHIYCKIHEDLRESKDKISAWLQEDASNEKTEEIYLVARKWGRILGVLYATLNKKPHEQRSTCLIWSFVCDPKLKSEDSLKLGLRLWDGLQWWVRETSETGKCLYFFETVGPDDEPLADSPEEKKRRIQYLDILTKINVRKINFQYIMADSEELDPKNELSALLFYKGRNVAELDTDTVLDNIYEFYFWDFVYGEQHTSLLDLKNRLDYFIDLLDRVKAVINGDKIELIEYAN